MLIEKNKIISKHNVLAKLRTHKANKFEVWDIICKDDQRNLLRHIEKLLRNESISVIVLPGEKK